MRVEWDPALELGVEPIDGQHKELFRRLDRLLTAMRARQGAVEVGRLLDYLGEYVVEHFGAEETLMRDRGYPGFQAHRLEHQRFLEDFQVLRQEHLAGGPSTLLVVRVTNRVTAWLREHIYRTDRALARFLQGPR